MVMAIDVVLYIIFGLLFWSICINTPYENYSSKTNINPYKNIQNNGFNGRNDLTIGRKNE